MGGIKNKFSFALAIYSCIFIISNAHLPVDETDIYKFGCQPIRFDLSPYADSKCENRTEGNNYLTFRQLNAIKNNKCFDYRYESTLAKCKVNKDGSLNSIKVQKFSEMGCNA